MNRALIYRIAGLVGLNGLARAVFARRLLVLSYHGVCGAQPDVADPDGLHVPVALFEQQMAFLTRHYRPVSLAEVRDSFFAGIELPPAAVLLTFDDGYRNVARYALPVLERMRIPAVLFPVPGLIERERWLWTSELEWRRGGDPDFPRLRSWLKKISAEARREWLERELEAPDRYPDCEHSLMNWDEINAIKHEIEIGSHSLNHDPLTGCDEWQLQAELSLSRRLLAEKAGIEAEAVAYPNGDFSPAVMAAAERAGYKLGFTTVARHVRESDEPLALPRILVGRSDTPTVLAARLAGWQEWVRR
ncbi:MAG: polysaccharide deacetylase family protein [Blastocatellia bacterium]